MKSTKTDFSLHFVSALLVVSISILNFVRGDIVFGCIWAGLASLWLITLPIFYIRNVRTQKMFPPENIEAQLSPEMRLAINIDNLKQLNRSIIVDLVVLILDIIILTLDFVQKDIASGCIWSAIAVVSFLFLIIDIKKSKKIQKDLLLDR